MIKETKIEATPINHSFLSHFFSKLLPKRMKPEEPTPSTSPFKSSISEYERIFHSCDEDGDGKISPSELRKCMKTVGEDISEEDAELVVLYADSDGDGLLGLEDFMKLVEVEEEEEKGRDLMKAFGVYAKDGQDCITLKSLQNALEKLGQMKSMEECEMMVRRFDLDGDGVISFDEFRIMMV